MCTPGTGRERRRRRWGWRCAVSATAARIDRAVFEGRRSGELAALCTFEQATIYPAKPISGFVFAMSPEEKEEAARQQNAQAADIQKTAEAIQPALTVLDELNVALSCGMVTQENAEKLIDAALAFGDVVSTGRNAPEWLRARADYVSEIAAQKHPFETEKLAAEKRN